jgi:hypothetical protein
MGIKVTDPEQRALGNLLTDILESIGRRERIQIESIWQLTKWLQVDFPKYKKRNFYTLRHDVAAAVAWVAKMHRLQLAREDLLRGAAFDEAVAAAQLRALEPKQVKVRKTLKRLRGIVGQLS